MKKEKPILFSTEMIRAILDGRKSVTRRVIKGANPNWAFDSLSDGICITGVDKRGNEFAKDVDGLWACFEASDYYIDFPMFKSKYQVGDILWVRETCCEVFNTSTPNKTSSSYFYKADLNETEKKLYSIWKWKPSIFMPKEAARIWLRITDIRVERLQEITLEDCIAEGIQVETPIFMVGFNSAKEIEINQRKQAINDYAELWNILYAESGYSWDTNPFCWVITFDRIDRTNETDR